MSDGPLKRVMESIASEAVPPGDVNLWPEILKRLDNGRTPADRRRALMGRRLAIPVLLTLGVLVVSLLLVGPERVLAALRGLLGYVPGIGIVDETGGLRVLAEPVSLEREGITVTIDQVVVDLEQTVIVYRAEGVPGEAYPRSEDNPGCLSSPTVRFSDGTSIGLKRGRMGGRGSSFEFRLVFGVIPANNDEFTFLIPCLAGTRTGAAPENWEFHLRLAPAPADFAMAPVMEIEPSAAPTLEAQRTGEMGLYLERVIELEDSFVLIGTFRQGSELPGAMIHGIAEWPIIEDATGYIMPIETPSDLDLVSTELGVFPWSYEVPKGFTSPLTITLDAVTVEFSADTKFEFDAGSDPQPGDEWPLDQTLEVAGHQVRLIKVTRLDDGYEFHFESDSSVSQISVTDLDHQPRGGAGGGQQGEFTVGFEYAEPVPEGILRYRILGLIARYPGPWKLTWVPPASNQLAAPLVVPEACLTLERWLQITQNPPELPEGIAGKLILFGRIKDDDQPQSPENSGGFTVELGSGTQRILGPGYWPSISPDGKNAAYSLEEGLRVVDLVTGEDHHLPATSINDYGPRWSPDGTEIAFMRTDDFNLYVMNADGSNIRQATEGPEYEQLVGWMPDGHTLAYTVPGPAEGKALRFLDLTTGDVREGLVLGKRKGLDAAISPDGHMIAYSGQVPGRMGYGLYVSNIDGSETRLLIQLDNRDAAHPVWSPDGDWLAVSIFNPNGAPPRATPALINRDMCDAIPLEGIDGQAFGWSR